jgi:hypothetical protein
MTTDRVFDGLDGLSADLLFVVEDDALEAVLGYEDFLEYLGLPFLGPCR